MENQDRVIGLNEWKNILTIVGFYNRNEGYVDFDAEGKFCFFDNDPCLNGVNALYVTREQVMEIIENY